MATLRLFIAVDLSADVIGALDDCRRRLGRDLAAIRWVRPEAMHLTLCFLGDTPTEHLEVLRETLAVATAAQGPIDSTASGIGVFPSVRRPAVLWAGVTGGAEALAGFAGGLRRALLEAGFQPDEKPFSAHITLGRFARDTRTVPGLEDLLERWRQTRFGRFTADRVTLYASTLTPAGPRYEPVGSWPLVAGT